MELAAIILIITILKILIKKCTFSHFPEDDKEPFYLGFFHTGAYQDSLSGYGGIKHCLIPAPKHIIIDKDDNGNYTDYVYRNEQSVEEMFNLLGTINMKNFAGIEEAYSEKISANILLQPIPYDGTSCWGKELIKVLKLL